MANQEIKQDLPEKNPTNRESPISDKEQKEAMNIIHHAITAPCLPCCTIQRNISINNFAKFIVALRNIVKKESPLHPVFLSVNDLF